MNISDYNEAHQILSKVRERYTQKELASLLHYSPRHISRWESGQIEIPYALLPALRVIASKPSKMKPESKFTFIDLFAGIGGIRMGTGSGVDPGGLLRQSRCGIGGGQGAAGVHQKADPPLRQGPNEFGAVQVKRPVVQMGMGIK